jgi:hypothetical protein
MMCLSIFLSSVLFLVKGHVFIVLTLPCQLLKQCVRVRVRACVRACVPNLVAYLIYYQLSFQTLTTEPPGGRFLDTKYRVCQ